MCGIAGIFAYDDTAPPGDGCELRRIRDHMAIRGPDGEGEWLSADRRVGFAHRRLAIIDLDPRAAQPMHSPDGALSIVFNGEIYNYRTLRRELEAEGANFRTESDTEVLLHLYRARGEAMVERLRGMFAFAIWDARNQRLFLARDPFGIKPLYLADDGRILRFASQVKALAAGGAISGEVSPAGMAGFFLWGHVPEPWTWLRAVRALPAGSTLSVRRGQRDRGPRRYFDLREEIQAAESVGPVRKEALAEALVAASDSVRHHLVADVPVGVFMSAGRDSTLVAALAARMVSAPLQTITLGFEEYRGTANDEAPYAERIAGRLKTQHRTVHTTRADFEQECKRLFPAMDQPSIDGVNTYFVSRAAAATGLKVVLSGLGGDELFGGYPSFRQAPRLARWLCALGLVPWFGRGVRAATAPVLRRKGMPKWAGLLEYGSSLAGSYLLRRSLFMPWELPRLMDPDLARQALEELRLLEDLDDRIRGIRNPVLQVMALELSCYMRNQLLRDADWAGMAHSLEIRVPLVDRDLFRQWLPIAVGALPFDRQQLLRAASPAVAHEIETRPKSGFGVPVEAWLREAARSTRVEPGLRPWARQVAQRFAPALRSLRPVMLMTDAFGGIGGIAKFNRDVLATLHAMPECREVVAFPRLVQREPEPIPAKVRYRFDAAGGKLSYVKAVLCFTTYGGPADVVLCGHLNLLPIAWLTSAVKQCPLLLIVYGIEAWRAQSRFVRLLLQRVDCLISISRFTAERLCAWSGLPPSGISRLPNCVDLSVFKRRPCNTKLARRLGLNGQRVLLTVGRLAGIERYKGFDEVLEVLPALAREGYELVYLIVGDGDDRPRLEQKAAELGVTNHVVFTGYVSEEEKLDLYSLADVYVMPSRGEGFGFVFLEAMACGLPVIGSIRDGSREALLDGQLGLLVDPDDRKALISAIRKAIERPRGRPSGLEQFSVETFHERLTALIRDVMIKHA